MQLRHAKTVLPAGDSLRNRVTAACWSPNNQKLAVATVQDEQVVIQVFDDSGERKDKFATKPSDPKVVGGAREVCMSGAT